MSVKVVESIQARAEHDADRPAKVASGSKYGLYLMIEAKCSRTLHRTGAKRKWR